MMEKIGKIFGKLFRLNYCVKVLFIGFSRRAFQGSTPPPPPPLPTTTTTTTTTMYALLLIIIVSMTSGI
jgi:hypothetical protein